MDDEEDEFIFFGTPLPEIEDETILRKKAARELEVRDERGRQRFHGAFTGGFSAGYFNTVGTKEGWAPSTFISSRKKVADRVQQNPEDFMDVEDFGEFGIATRKIHTTSNFHDSTVESRKRKFPELDSAIPGEAPLKDIVRPVRESIGIKILTKLGWRLGQGIGPRVKKQVGSTKVYGCSPFPSNYVAEEDDPSALSFTFAPQDTAAEFFHPKDNVFGLGYTGLSKESVLGTHIDLFNPTSTKSFLKKDKKKLTISGQAFGVGAFEDDDDDIYSKDDMSQYDFCDLNSKDSDQVSKDKGYQKHQDLSEKVLEGFCKATQPSPIRKYYPPPDVPPRYKPICSTVPKVPAAAESKFTSRHNMSASDRSLLLGEKKFQPFQLTAETKKIEVKNDSSDKLKICILPRNTHTFRPFPSDEQKQKRYEDYVKLKSSGDVEKLIQPSSMTEWERQQELEEFARASVLFKPLSAALSSKFESKSHLNVEHEVMDALAKARKENAEKITTAEKRKLVGLGKRKTMEWHPASLLCKRFNVPNPFPNSSEPSSKSEKSKSLFDHISFQTRETDPIAKPSIPSSESNPKEETSITSSGSVKRDSNSIAPITKEIEVLQVRPTENKRPPIDFFKDIFENSSEDEDANAAEPEAQPSNNVPKSPQNSSSAKDDILESPSTDPGSSKPKPIATNKKSGFGVFANLDLDALNQRTQAKKTIPQDTKDIHDSEEEAEKSASMPENNPSSSSDLYGPELPPNYSALQVTRPPDIYCKRPSVDHMKRSKHKMKHKHKHHKNKSKKKKKKKSSRKSSDDSSFDSDVDIPPAVILDRLKKVQKLLKTDSSM